MKIFVYFLKFSVGGSRSQGFQKYLMLSLSWDPSGPSGPKSPKKFLGPSGPGVQKVSEKVSEESPESQKGLV